MRFLFSKRRPSKGDPPSLQSSSDESSRSADSEAAVFTYRGHSPSSSSPTTALIKTSPQRTTASASSATSLSPSRKTYPLTPTRKKGYSFVAEAKVGAKKEDLVVTPGKGRFGFVRLVSRIRTRSYGPPKEDVYAPPSAVLLPPPPVPEAPPVVISPTTPTNDLWKKLFGPTMDAAELKQESPDSSKRSKGVPQTVNVTFDDGADKQNGQLLLPSQEPTLQQARQQLILSQPTQQDQQRDSSPAQTRKEERHVHDRDEVSAKELTASFIYDDCDDEDFNDETSRSVATGNSSVSDSMLTDMSGYTSTLTGVCTKAGTSNTTPRRGSTSHRFDPLQCDGVEDDEDFEQYSIPQQGLAEGLMEDVKSVLAELARDILCLPNQNKKGA